MHEQLYYRLNSMAKKTLVNICKANKAFYKGYSKFGMNSKLHHFLTTSDEKCPELEFMSFSERIEHFKNMEFENISLPEHIILCHEKTEISEDEMLWVEWVLGCYRIVTIKKKDWKDPHACLEFVDDGDLLEDDLID